MEVRTESRRFPAAGRRPITAFGAAFPDISVDVAEDVIVILNLVVVILVVILVMALRLLFLLAEDFLQLLQRFIAGASFAVAMPGNHFLILTFIKQSI